MSSELVPHQGNNQVATSDADNRYKAVQEKLGRLAAAMDDAAAGLEGLRRDMQRNADRAQGLADDIENAGLDPKYVQLTATTATALGGAAHEVRELDDLTREVSDRAHETKATHCRLYEGLDTVRSSRRDRTPKPGFFAH